MSKKLKLLLKTVKKIKAHIQSAAFKSFLESLIK